MLTYFRLIRSNPKNMWEEWRHNFLQNPRQWRVIMTLKLTVPAYWTTIIKFLMSLDGFYFSSVQLSVKYHSLSLSQCHIQIIKSGEWRTERKFWWWGPRKRLHRAVISFLLELVMLFLVFRGFCKGVTVSWFLVDFFTMRISIWDFCVKQLKS